MGGVSQAPLIILHFCGCGAMRRARRCFTVVQRLQQVPLTLSKFLGFAWGSLLSDKATLAVGRTHQCSVSLSNWGVNNLQGRYGDVHVLSMRPHIVMNYSAFPVFLATTSRGVLTLTVMTTSGTVGDHVAAAVLRKVRPALLFFSTRPHVLSWSSGGGG